MRKLLPIFPVFFLIIGLGASGQDTLPSASVRNIDKTIIISWLNHYQKPIQNIFIQRSYDSLKNFTTIGTVLNPTNAENGYPDNEAPYDRMYYRLLITFDGGSYVTGPSTRPAKEITELEDIDITAIPATINDNQDNNMPGINVKPGRQELKPIVTEKNKPEKVLKIDSALITNKPLIPKKIIETPFPSNRIFTSKQNIVVIHLPEFEMRKYQIRFYDENEKQAFEVRKITDEYLYIDKSNFVHSGWFRFEIYENGELFEKNKVFVSKDKNK